MGHPTAPLALLTLLLLFLPPAAPSPPCFSLPSDPPAELDLTNRSHRCPELDWSLFQGQRRLVLSHNGIETLSPTSHLQPGLEELDLSYNLLRDLPPAFLSRAGGLRHLGLQHNRLRELPPDFFANATALRSLWLEGNPLPAVPPTAFQPTLRELVVLCDCRVVGSVLASCSCSQPNCSVPQCRCLTSRLVAFNLTHFHARQCQGGVGLVAGLAGAAGGVALLLVVVVVAAVVCYRRRKEATVAAGAGWGKRESAAPHGQPRYISRAEEMDGTDGTAAAAATTAPDYENIFVSPCAAPRNGWKRSWDKDDSGHRDSCPVMSRHTPRQPG
uniref:Uncharacterized protein n=1 Tax=Calidris pygmaea TaxID=425635 RepID=A0A8C3KP53_9CHAR